MNQTPEEPELARSDISREQEESVRRLLAQARANEPMPEAVRARLEAVLRQLGTEEDQGATSPVPAPVIDLAVRRRKRVRAVFLAAAAVTAFGVAVPQLLQSNSMDQSAVSGAETADEEAPAAATQEDSGTDRGDATADQPGPASAAAPPTLRADRFAVDAQAALDHMYLTNELSDFLALAPACLGDTEGTSAAGRAAIAVRYAGRDAALLLQTPVNGAQRAVLYVCGESEPRRTAVLTVR